MDLSRESGMLPTHTAFGEPALSSAQCQAESGQTILLQLLEFKTHLLEAVEELHIRRDAETRFEDQISKLVLDKQELEWEKESLQHQIETVANQHRESLTSTKKQFQAKLRNTEEEKGKYQVIAELKDKEINNLKEELKSLQLLKYNLEKKSNELEQKLVLQMRSKDSHLNQLGEVEKRFSALSRQCAMVKQAHEKLEQNVDEAMRINRKLTSANEKQERTIISQQEELDEVRNKLIKVKMTSVKHDKSSSPTVRKQDMEQLQLKLNMETEMNMKLREENKAERANKQEMMRSLQHTQQLLLSQTQTVRIVELELQAQRETYQALKREHEVIQEKSKAMEEKVAQLMESCAASKTSWDKEKTRFLDHMKNDQEDFQALKKAYDKLHLKHTELSIQAKTQAQHLQDLEMRDSSQGLCVSEAQLFPTLVEDIKAEETLHEPSSSSRSRSRSSSEQPGLGSLQDSASSPARTPDRLQDTGAVITLVTTGANRGMEPPTTLRQPSNTTMFTCPLTTTNISNCYVSGTSLSNLLNNSDTSDPSVILDLNVKTIPASDVSLQISKVSFVSERTAVPNTEARCVDGSGNWLSEEKQGEGKKKMDEQEQNDNIKQESNKRDEEDINTEQQEVQGEDVMVGGRRGTLTELTTDRHQGRKGSDKEAEEISQAETETTDRAEGGDTDGGKEKAETGQHTPDTQTHTDTVTQRSHALQVVDFMDTEPPLSVSEDCSHVTGGNVVGRKGQTVCDGLSPNIIIQEVQHLCHNEVQPFCQDADTLKNMLSPVCQGLEDNTHERPHIKTSGDPPAEQPELLNQSSMQTDGLSEGIVSVKELEASQNQTEMCKPDMTHTDETHVSEDDLKEQPSPQCLESSEQRGQLLSLVTCSDCSCKTKDCQANIDTCENTTEQMTKEPYLDTCTDVLMNPVDLVSDREACQAQMETHKTEDSKMANTETELKLSVHLKCERDESSEANSSKGNLKPLLEKVLCDSASSSSLPSKKTYSPLFEWGTAQRKTLSSKSKSDVSSIHQLTQGPSMFDKNLPGPAGVFGHPTSTAQSVLRNTQSKAPLVIMRASELLKASSASGTAASSMRHQQGEGEVKEEAHTDSATLSFPASSTMGRILSWQTPQECSRFATSTAGPRSESDWEASCSQEREEQQESFRAKISKIEQFLNTERLRMPKRRRTEE